MFSFIKKLFSGNVKRLANYGDGLAQVAQITLYMILMEQLSNQNSNKDKDAIRSVASSWSNYLFGRPPSDQHKNLDLDAEHAKAIRWLDNEGAPYQKLVIQGLRIIATANYARSGTAKSIGIEILERYGKNFPDSPDLDSYGASLVLIIVGDLDEESRNNVYHYIWTGPYAPYFKTSKALGWN
ncbi:hypothetical protein [Sulfuriferula nivalis]|uniref:Uncharacterized protein n=1 Tax=Sulfuriferula nivalis TaxID=2675298 RepID=A0A809RER2_9PROT|nr:hypothetical protein [Sulfuriferula nivalis]BBO99353.1 hypothetical protein SFSGTM_00620 [Sulfuriferula nivalis]